MDNKNDNILDEDTLYFNEEDKVNYEPKQKTYSEEDMFENYKPMTNTNSVEYDDGDYASPLYGADRQESEDNKKVILAYIFVMVVVSVVVGVALFRLK